MIVIYSLAFFILVFSAIIALYFNHSIIAQGLLDFPGFSTLYFGCEKYRGIFHCDGLHNMLESYNINSNSSTVYNATDVPMFAAGKQGSALQMYANHLKSIIFSNSSTNLPKQFSVAFWIRAVPLPDEPVEPGIGYIVSQFNKDTKGGWSFSALNMQNLSQELVRFTVYNDKSVAFASPGVPIVNNDNFTHIVGTFDGSSIKVYKDGVFFGESMFNGTYNNNIRIPLTLGVASSSPMLFYWTGRIDNLRYYNKAISSNEIKQIFNEEQSIGNYDSQNLIGYWKFDGNLSDASANNHPGSERTLISSMVFAPDGRLFFSEKDTGNIKVMENGEVNPRPFATLYDHYSNWEQGLLGLAIDPEFKKNHYIYLFYTTIDKGTRNPYNKIVRFTEINGEGTNESVILDKIPASNGYHSGGAMSFGSDGKLYVTIGDGTRNIRCGNLPNSTGDICPAQDPSSLLGKVLRINRDGSIPVDNPYPNSPVYNIGHLNMYGIAFDNAGFGLISENGDSLYDEINTIEKSANYGSPTLQPFNVDPELSSNSTKPLRSYYTTYCLSQIIYYNGNKIPHLKDKFLVGSLSSSHSIFALKVDDTSNKIVSEEVISLNNFPNDEVVTLAQSPNGDVYYAGYNINKLDSVNVINKTQLLFPIEINYTSSILDIANLSFVPDNKEISMDVDVKLDASRTIERNVNNSNVNSNLKVSIPKQLLDGITSVTADYYSQNGIQKSKPLDFNIENPLAPKYTTVRISLKENGHYRLLIFGESAHS